MPPVSEQTSDGKSFVAFGLSVTVPATKGMPSPSNISVAADKADAASLTEGRRVAIDGVLRIKGAPEKRQYFNLSAETIELDPVAESGIGGEMEFRGTLCKDIVTPTDKKETASSASRHTPPTRSAMRFYSVFVRFVRFSEAMEPFLVPKGKIETKGELRITSFNGNLDFSCKIAELSEYKKLRSDGKILKEPKSALCRGQGPRPLHRPDD